MCLNVYYAIRILDGRIIIKGIVHKCTKVNKMLCLFSEQWLRNLVIWRLS